MHSYPYDWRTKKPVFFRTTEQWFANVSHIVPECVKAINSDIKFVPPRGAQECRGVTSLVPMCIITMLLRAAEVIRHDIRASRLVHLEAAELGCPDPSSVRCGERYGGQGEWFALRMG